MAPAKSTGIIIAEAVEAFLARCEQRHISPATMSKYRTFTKQLTAFCDAGGYTRLAQLSVIDMDGFYASRRGGKRARAKLERLRAFVKFALKRKWLKENIADDLQAREGSSLAADKMPFSEDELTRIYAACDALGEPTAPGPGYRNWSGEDVKDFVRLSVYTGLRISDVATFDITKRLNGSDVYLRQHETRKPLFTWLPDWLVARLRARELKYGPLVFAGGESRVMRSMAERWRVRLQRCSGLLVPLTSSRHRTASGTRSPGCSWKKACRLRTLLN